MTTVQKLRLLSRHLYHCKWDSPLPLGQRKLSPKQLWAAHVLSQTYSSIIAARMQRSPPASPNGPWQPQPQRRHVRWRSTQEVMIDSQRGWKPAWPLSCSRVYGSCCLMSGTHTHARTNAYKRSPHILVRLIKCCVWWWKLCCDERVCVVLRCGVNVTVDLCSIVN